MWPGSCANSNRSVQPKTNRPAPVASLFARLMGDDVEARRTFIETNALHVTYLDV